MKFKIVDAMHFAVKLSTWKMLLSILERAVRRKRNDSCYPEMAHQNGKIHRAVRGPNSFSPVRPDTPSPEEVLCRNLAIIDKQSSQKHSADNKIPNNFPIPWQTRRWLAKVQNPMPS